MYAALPESDRQKGHLSACIAKANKLLKKRGSAIRGVVTDAMSPQKADKLNQIWGKFGFTHNGMINFVPHLFGNDPKILLP